MNDEFDGNETSTQKHNSNVKESMEAGEVVDEPS